MAWFATLKTDKQALPDSNRDQPRSQTDRTVESVVETRSCLFDDLDLKLIGPIGMPGMRHMLEKLSFAQKHHVISHISYRHRRLGAHDLSLPHGLRPASAGKGHGFPAELLEPSGSPPGNRLARR